MNRGQATAGFTGFVPHFVVLAQPSVSVEPSERAFDHPTPRNDAKLRTRIAAFHDLDDPTAKPLEPLLPLGPDVAAVRPDLFQPGEFRLTW